MTCCKYTAGMLKEPVTVQRATRVSDGAGGSSSTWAAVAGAPSRAMVKPMSGRERWASQRVEALATHLVVIRYWSGLVESDRLVIRGRVHDIQFIRNVDFEDRWLEIMTVQGEAT